MEGITMFNFRIINLPDGNQIIDPSLKTPYNALTPMQMIDYIEMDETLAFMDKIRRKTKKEETRRNKLAKNPFYRMVCVFVSLYKNIF